MKSEYEIVREIWEEGSPRAKVSLGKYRNIVESFAMSCMTRMKEEMKK